MFRLLITLLLVLWCGSITLAVDVHQSILVTIPNDASIQSVNNAQRRITDDVG